MNTIYFDRCFSKIFLAFLLFLLGTGSVFADDIEKGKELAKQKGCTECHGLTGNSYWDQSPPPLPKIAGMPERYLVSALKAYRSLDRKHDQMNAIMKIRTDEEIELLSKYFAAQKQY